MEKGLFFVLWLLAIPILGVASLITYALMEPPYTWFGAGAGFLTLGATLTLAAAGVSAFSNNQLRTVVALWQHPVIRKLYLFAGLLGTMGLLSITAGFAVTI